MNDQSVATHARTVTLERVLPGPIERVWEYLVDGEKRKTWFAGGEFERRVGGKGTLVFDHSLISPEKETPEQYRDKPCDSACTITKYDPPRLLAYTFPRAGERSEVTFELSAHGKGVLLRLTHREIDERAVAVSVSAGWDAHLQILEDRLNGDTPRGFWTLHAKLEREYDRKL